MRPSHLILSAILAVGCSRNIEVDDTNDGDDTSDTDTGDTDTGDTDTGGTETGNPDTAGGIDCSTPYTTSPPDGTGDDFCHTGTIACGDEVYATTAGGSEHYNDDHYLAFACWDPRETGIDYTGPERVYDLLIPAHSIATITMEGPCEPLSLRILDGLGECHLSNNNTVGCDRVDPRNPTQVVTFSNPLGSVIDVEVIVDSQELAANFRLTVDCEQ